MASGKPRTILILFWAAASLFAIVLLLSIQWLLSTQAASQTCSTPACVLAAADILHTVSSPSRKIDPCTNFRDYVCAGWDSRNELHADQSHISRRSTLSEQTQGVLRQIIESSGPHSSRQSNGEVTAEKRAFAKLKKTYVSCMDEAALESRGLTPMIDTVPQVRRILRRPDDVLARDHKGWIPSPARHLEGREQPSLTEVIQYLMNQGVDALITFRTKIDDEDPSTNSLLIRPLYRHGLLSREMNEDESLVREYKTVMTEVLSQVYSEADLEFHPSKGRALAVTKRAENSSILEGLVQSLVDFERRLTDALPPRSKTFDVTEYYNVYSLKEAESLVPHISLRELILSQTGGTSPKRVVVTAPAYLETLSETLRETDRAALEAFFIWRVIQTHAKNVKAKAVEPLLAFEGQLEGRTYKPDNERWRLCVRHVNAGLEWMSQDAKDVASEKLRNITQEIAYPTKNPDMRRPSEVEERYSNMRISEDDYFRNVILFAQAKHHDRFAKLAKSSADREWDRDIETVDAYFSPAGNQIVVPGGIMQPPVYYGPRLPSYLTYGAFGALMGHEISHAFDSMGRYFDADGNQTDWWDSQTKAQDAQRSQCFIDQYSQFSATGPDGGLVHLDGALTLDENLADDRGLRAAFQAWQTRNRKNPDKKLVGLERFSKEQIFFLSYGRFWCSKSQAETMQTYLKSNVHSPDFARIMVCHELLQDQGTQTDEVSY
ncbi:MAG: hypothetical protein Q9182_006392 [Xanthomendoza sp. 2 TL-2023]